MRAIDTMAYLAGGVIYSCKIFMAFATGVYAAKPLFLTIPTQIKLE
jgi:hypothetical protein